jgi:starch synthase
MSHVLLLASESAPFIKTGGLGEVIGSLPKALKAQNVQVSVMIPDYIQIPEEYREKMSLVQETVTPLGWRQQYVGLKKLVHEGVNYYFLDNEQYFKRDWLYGQYDDGERFVFFCQAALTALPYLDDFPDIIHCHDWQTAIVPLLLRAFYQDAEEYKAIKTVFTIHNLKFQGIFPRVVGTDLMNLPEGWLNDEGLEFYGKLNFMKSGIVYCDVLTTVSPTYAEEIKTPFYGENLHGLIQKYEDKLFGILNGIDPLAKPLKPKAEYRNQLQERLGLPFNAKCPIVSMVGRFTAQKGMDLIMRVIDEILLLDVQMVMLGGGEAKYEWMLREVLWHNPSKLRVHTTYEQDLADLIYSASDIYLMPSLYEPCGIGQMIAMQHGAAPVVRETGGLKDTVTAYDPETGAGNGFSFSNFNAHELLYTVQDAVNLYYDDPDAWKQVAKQAAAADFSWAGSAGRYKALYEQLRG